MSYLRGAAEDPLLDVTFGQLLDDTAAKWPDREAYVFKKTGSRIKFSDLQDKATRLAAGLKAIGTEPGDVVAWLFGHRPEWIYLYFAVAKLGAIALPLQEQRIGRSVETMNYFLNKTGVKVLIMGDDSGLQAADGTTPFLFSLFPEIRTASRGKLHIDRIPTLSAIVVLEDKATGPSVYTMEDLQTLGDNETLLAEVRALQDQLSCHDTVMLGFTSGSTGPAKCAELSTYSLHNDIRFIGKAVGLPNEGTVLYPYLSFRFAVIYPFTAGCTLVVPASESPSPVDIMQIIQEERCKAIGVLFMKECHGLFHSPDLGDYDLSSLERVLVTGNVTPKSLVDHAAKVLPSAKLFVGYGGTEFLFLTSTAAEMVAEGKGTTVGKLLQHAEIKIVGKDGQVVPLGQEGEVYVRAYSLFNCYRADKEKTAKALTADGWYKTGDVGALDEKGVLKILGRVSDMIIRDSYNVHPTVIESSLSKHPKVVSVPDPASVEEICACIILNEGQIADSQEMTTFCAEIGLVPIETPGYFLFMDAFPMISTQRKVDRKKLRLVAMDRLGLKEEA
ncbi:medium-chain acyl-CoA ligase ACSF2, mitochondrial-like isoform X2 [Branchiostoma floridae x Branchiostoma belcheri]